MINVRIHIRLLSALLAGVLCLGLLPPLPVRAEQTDDPSPQPSPTQTVQETTAATQEPTTQPVPETTVQTVPETTTQPASETTIQTVPETTTQTVPVTTTQPPPESTEPASTVQTAPETTAQTVPQTTALTVSNAVLFGAIPLEEESRTLWYPTSLEEVLPTDIVTVTAWCGDSLWAMAYEDGAVTPVLVSQENGALYTPEAMTGWTISQEVSNEAVRYTLRPQGSSTWLYVNPYYTQVLVGTGGAPYWKWGGSRLTHAMTNKNLTLDQIDGWTTTSSPGSELTFWRRPRTAGVTAEPASGTVSPEQTITLSCPTENAAIYYALSTDGVVYTDYTLYSGPLQLSQESSTMYLRCYAQAESLPAGAETNCAYTIVEKSGPGLYFGLLHAHTNISDGVGSVEEAFSHAAQVEGLDFFAVTDHSDSFDEAPKGAIGLEGNAVSTEWAAGKAAAAAVTGPNFVGIFGYEMSWPETLRLGHIGTFCTPGWQCWGQEEFSTLERYYQALTTVSGAVGQFNHPGQTYGDFEGFTHHRGAYDQVMALLEVGGEGSFRAYDAYTKALDAGWHVAPTISQNNHNGLWGDASDVRTVLWAQALTEEDLYQAMRQRRVYATEDRDLAIYYQLNGAAMGSTIGASETVQLQIDISDPTDDAIGTVEVIVDGGAVATSRTVTSAQEVLSLTLPGSYSYYYLRITQPDGDVAVTAPVWLEQYQDLGIASFDCVTAVPVQGQPAELRLTLFNEEGVDCPVERLTFTADGVSVHEVATPGTIAAGQHFSYTFSWTHPGMGVVNLEAQAVVQVAGQSRTYSKTLTLSFQPSALVQGIAVYGGRQNLDNLTTLAAGENTQVASFSDAIPEGARVVLVEAPEEAFSQEFLEEARRYAEGGGSLILCGGVGQAQTMNPLLEALGVSMRMYEFAARARQTLYSEYWNPEAPWLRGLEQGQTYRYENGCAVAPNSGVWMVRASDDADAAVLMAGEETPWGGTVLAAGCMFLADGLMPLPDSKWVLPSVNQSVLEALLAQEAVPELAITPIADVRAGTAGNLYRIRGYVTAGTANAYNRFPSTIYVQDDSGGIAVTPFDTAGIPVGAPIEVAGCLEVQGGNLVLSYVRHTILDEDAYRYVPVTSSCANAMDYAAHGGELMQVQGQVESVFTDGQAVLRFTVKDAMGGTATVSIESGIGAGSTGKNTLATQVIKGRTVRAMGILHLDESGQPVLRVRNCEEVVYVPLIPDHSNPKTGEQNLLTYLFR